MSLSWLKEKREQCRIEDEAREIRRAAYNQTLEVLSRIGRRHAESMTPYEALLFQELIRSLYRMNPHDRS